MIVKGEIGQQVLVKAEITAIQVSRDYRDNGIQTKYTLKLHESDALGDTYFKILSSDIFCFDEADENEVPEEVENATLPEDDEWSHPEPKKRGRPRKATVEDLVRRAKEESS